ncbi:MAG: hypothetical protein IKQ60_10860 [Candidatus Methanomethylophilaceae archaeon]|nr:hypothetical protein [Candidatus Methanomethylophilaceae archaeon]
MPQGFDLSRAEESDILGRAVEKLDLYVRLCMDEGRGDSAESFLSDGRYVRFALKQFADLLLSERPWLYSNSPSIDMEKVYRVLEESLSGSMKVLIDPGHFDDIIIEVDDALSIHLALFCLPGHIEVTLNGPDDDWEWKYPVAAHLSDDFALSLLEQGLDDPFALTEEHLDDFCGLVLYLHEACGRIEGMAQSRAEALAGRYGLRT